MSKSKIYTKTGDAGETSILSGERVKKFDPRISVYGDIDELNSFIGCVYAFREGDELANELKLIQSKLFSIGAIVSCPLEKRDTYKLQAIVLEDIQFLEQRIDFYDGQLPALKNFILPGGSKANSFLHVCRSVCRRAERECIRYNEELKGDIPSLIITYLNRLSDYFFVLSRYVIHCDGHEEVIWKSN